MDPWIGREIFVRPRIAFPIQAEENDLILNGLLGNPGQSRSTRKEMIFFVNRETCGQKTISYAVVEAFHFCSKRQIPPAILFLEIDPAAVDVVLHRFKREIRFRNEPQSNAPLF